MILLERLNRPVVVLHNFTNNNKIYSFDSHAKQAADSRDTMPGPKETTKTIFIFIFGK